MAASHATCPLSSASEPLRLLKQHEHTHTYGGTHVAGWEAMRHTIPLIYILDPSHHRHNPSHPSPRQPFAPYGLENPVLSTTFLTVVGHAGRHLMTTLSAGDGLQPAAGRFTQQASSCHHRPLGAVVWCAGQPEPHRTMTLSHTCKVLPSVNQQTWIVSLAPSFM